MKTLVILATLILGVSIVLAEGELVNFMVEFPEDKLGISYKKAECHWQGNTTWYGHCHPTACPDPTLWTKYEQAMSSNGWERVAAFIGEFFHRKLGNVTIEQDVNYKFGRSLFQDFGSPCFTGGRKILCCKAGLTGAISSLFYKK